MQVRARKPHPAVVLAEDRSTATVVLPAGLDAEASSELALQAAAKESGVEITGAVSERLSKISARYKANQQPIVQEFAWATPPVDGTDASIEWVEGLDPATVGQWRETGADGSVDFYARKSFISVAAGERIATLHPATAGTNGRDVCGGAIPATPGTRIGIAIDKTLVLDDQGGLIARIDGVLKLSHAELRIDPVLEIAGTVDFSTGHIDFDGDVFIQNDIRDRFRVSSTKNVTIEGLIDASHIICRGNLVAGLGVAGRDEGTLDVGGDAVIGYIDKVRGSIGGSLRISSAILHCDLTVGGDLSGESGRIVGGRLHVDGNVTIGSIGSRVDTPTHLRIGRDCSADIGRSAGACAAPDASNPAKCQDAPETGEIALQMPPARCSSQLEVLKMIHARVTLEIGGRTVTFGEDLRGPVKIWHEGATLMHQLGSAAPTPLLQARGVREKRAA